MAPLSFLRCLVLASVPALLVAAPSPDYATPYAFTTLAGLSSIGSTDGPGNVARFYNPVGAAVDAQGNVYIADHGNNTIRKITPAGVVSTIAGTPGVRGSTDGPGADALLINPEGLTTDSTGNVYVADKINQVIRKITPAGTVSTLAGGPGPSGFVDGDGAAARFAIPSDVVLDAAGNLYVADQINNAIRKVTPTGTVTTYAGKTNPYTAIDGPVASAGFFYPYRLALDATGTLYVSEIGNGIIRRISTDGQVSTFAGVAGAWGATDGSGTAARFRNPAGLAVDRSGNLWVADTGNGTIRKITPDGTVSTPLGQAQEFGSVDGVGTAARFHAPRGLSIDAAGNLYVTDYVENVVRKITPALEVTTLAGLPNERSAGSADGTAAAARFKELAGAAVAPNGDVYVADTINSTVRKISRDGTVTTLAGKAGVRGNAEGTGDQARFDSPYGITVGDTGTIYVSDAVTNVIRQVTAAGVVTTLAGDATAAPGTADGTGNAARFNQPTGLAMGKDGNLYVADRDNFTVRRVTPAGVVTTLAGSPGNSGNVDGTGASALLEAPLAVATDAAGNVYTIGAVRHGTLRKITSAGVVTTVAGGSGGPDDAVDGIGSAARFNESAALAADQAGNVYVADAQNHVVRRVSPAGAVTTLAGFPAAAGQADGFGRKSRFLEPLGISVDAQGAVYVTSGTIVRKGLLATAPVITTHPASQSVAAGGGVTLSVEAAGSPAPTYQWRRNGTAIANATSRTLAFSAVGEANAGEYTVIATNDLGSVTSNAATLSITSAPTPPAPPSTGGGSGGGGAPSPAFLLALAFLAVLRWRTGRHGLSA